jgi:hypothetical protein
LAERDTFVLAALALSVVVLLWRARVGPRPGAAGSIAPPAPAVPTRLALALLGVWAGAQAVMLIVEPVMWRPHVSQIIVPLALLAALRPAPWPAIVLAALLVSPLYASNVSEILWPDAYDRNEQAVVDRLERLPTRAEVITDDPGLAWRAGHHPPGLLVDASIKRVQLKQITAARIERDARGPNVCAVLVWADVRFGSLDELPGRLESAGYHVAARYGGPRVLYTRGRCAASD